MVKSYLTLQEMVKTKESGKTVYYWEDVETFDDLESKHEAEEDLRKRKGW